MSTFRAFFGLTWQQRRVPGCCIQTLASGFQRWLDAILDRDAMSIAYSLFMLLFWFVAFIASSLTAGVLAALVDAITMPWQLRAQKRWAAQAAVAEAVCAALRPPESEVIVTAYNVWGYCASCVNFVPLNMCNVGLTPAKCTALGHGLIEMGRAFINAFGCDHWRSQA